MIHQALFWLKNPNDPAARDTLVAGLRTLGTIDIVQSLRIGIPATTESRDVVDASFDVMETMEFASLADQAAYQNHPAHCRFIEECAHLWAKVVVYDTETI